MPKHLTRPQFHAIKRELAIGTSKLSVASKFNVSYETVRKISHATTWAKYGENKAIKAAEFKLSRRTPAATSHNQSFVTRDEVNSLQREVRTVRQRVENLELAEAKRNRRWFGRIR